MTRPPQETFVEQQVTYSIEIDGQFVVVEHVPARVCVETGERLFSPETVRRLEDIVRGKHGLPTRMTQAPVYDFAA